MTDYEKELLYIIRTHDNPEQALEIAIDIILAVLEQSESCQEPSFVCSPVLA